MNHGDPSQRRRSRAARPVRQIRGASRPRTDRTLLWCLVGALAFLGGIVTLRMAWRWQNRPPPARQSPTGSAGDARGGARALQRTPSSTPAARPPPSADEPQDAPPEGTGAELPPPSAAPPGPDADAGVARRIEVREAFDPLVDPLVGLEGDAGDPSDSKAEPSLSLASDENRLFTLSLSGILNRKRLASDDRYTWARLGYFLQQETKRRYFLIFPGGYVPWIRKIGKDGEPEELRAEERREQGPRGSRYSPGYRMVVEAEAGSSGSITFYGTKLAGKYTCRIACRLEKLEGERFKLIRHLAVSENINPTKKTQGVTEDQYARMVYKEALDKLLSQLRTLPLFGGRAPRR